MSNEACQSFMLPGIHKKYSETVVPRIAKAACEILDIPQQQLMDMFGYAFVTFVGKLPKQEIRKVLNDNGK